MNATVVIPTYWAGDDACANAPGTYDHFADAALRYDHDAESVWHHRCRLYDLQHRIQRKRRKKNNFPKRLYHPLQQYAQLSRHFSNKTTAEMLYLRLNL